MSAPRLLALSTAVPRHVLHQAAVRARALQLFGDRGEEIQRMAPVFDNAGIATRYSCVPLDWYGQAHGWAERNRLYLDSAVGLLEQVAGDCLAAARLEAQEIDAIVVVSTTGIATPSLDAVLINRMGFREDVQRLPIFGFGCAGGVLGLARAAALARAAPDSRVLLLVVELCGLCFRKVDDSKTNIVAAALFGDGAAGAVLSCRGEGPRLGPSGEHTWPGTLDIMGWDVVEDGLQPVFSRNIPALVRRELRAAADQFLTRHDLSVAGIDRFLCHPGGAKVIVALEQAYDLPAGTLQAEREVLAAYGNMSAATVLFVLDDFLRRGCRQRALLSALGPGFTAAFSILDNR